MQKRSLKSESTRKIEQDRSCWKILTWSKSTVNGWRVLTWQCDVTLGLTWQFVKRGRRVVAVCPSACGVWGILMARGARAREGRNFRWRVEARVRFFPAILGWVFLGIVCSVTLCLCFDSWMSKTMRSESC